MSAPASRLVSIGKRRWLMGMVWRSYEEKPGKARLREEADELQMDWAVVRVSEEAIQGGFSQSLPGMKRPKNCYSLAAVVADAQPQPWLGIYRIEDGLWWYIAIRDGQAILPDGDIVGGEEEILAARERHAGFGDWTYLEGNLDDLEKLIERARKKPAPVRALRGVPDWVRPAAGAGLAVAVAGAGAWWWHERQLAEIQAQQAAMARMRAKMALHHAASTVPASPLLTIPNPDAWLRACANAVAGLPLSKDGWVQTGVACAAYSATVDWRRESGATAARRPAGAMDQTGNAVTQTIPLIISPRGQDNAASLPDEKTALLAMLQAMGIEPAIQTAATPTAPIALANAPTSKTGAAHMPPAVPQASVSFTLPVSPFSIHWNSLPGFRLLRAAAGKDGQWNIQGVLYGR